MKKKEDSITVTDDDIKDFDSIMKFHIGNRIVFNSVKAAIANHYMIIPFVGSGVSAFIYPTWENVLLTICDSIDDEEITRKTKKLIANKLFLDAAQYLSDSLRELVFLKTVRGFFSEDLINDEQLKVNAAFYIPKICNGNCLTTNFDRIIEHACGINNVIYDTAGITELYKLHINYRNPQISNGLIFKIHGDILSNSDQLIITRDSYQKHYCDDGDVRRELKMWIAGRQFLFIGSSLFYDEPIKILLDEVQEGIENYAIYACKKEDIPSLNKQFERLNIFPIYYDENNHKLLITILKHLIS